MLSDNGRLMALSELLLNWQRGSREWPADKFAPRACELLAELLPFDACLWGQASAAPTRLLVLCGQGVDPAALASIEAEPAALSALLDAAPGTTFFGSALAVQPSHGPGSALSTVQLDPTTGNRVFLSVWRGAGQPAFGEDDRRIKQFLMPHWHEALRESRLAEALPAARARPALRSRAVCDRRGALLQIDARCSVLFRLEWPRWAAPALPAPLLAALQAQAPCWRGRQISVRIGEHGGALQLDARPRSPSDRLSPRQRGIADLYAGGSSGQEIASRLGLSPSTVSNHLGEVFKKLQVRSKLALARALEA